MGTEDPRPYWLVPARELNPPWEAMERVRPLTEAEQADLRRRLNAPGGHRLALTAAERDHLARVGPVRDTAQVRELRSRARSQEPADDFTAGVEEALAFAAGERPGPVSGRHSAHRLPTGTDLGAEEALVQRLLRGEQATGGQPPRSYAQAFLVGVEHTLMWLLCRSDQPPVSLDPSGG
jgi:hypothetical protein